MNTIRSNNLYISNQLHRWLKWMAEIESAGPEGTITSDALAEKILREHVLSRHPNMQEAEKDYWTARNKLDGEAVNKLKEQTASHERGTPKD